MASGIPRTLAAIALVLLAGVPAFAQNDAYPPIDRELAWGSWNAGRDRDVTAIPWLTQIVEARIDTEAWSPPVDFALCGDLGGSISCGILIRAPGMPPWPAYVLTDGDDLDADEQLLADGPERVAFRRLVAPAGSGPRRGGSDVDAPSAHDRLRYLAALAGPQTLLSGDESRTMAWYPGLDVRPTLVDLRRDVTERHAALVRDLVVAGYVTAEEAAGLTVQVDMEVVDRHTP